MSTIKNEQNEKYLILRKKYVHECPDEEAFDCHLNEKNTSRSSIELERGDTSARSIGSESDLSQVQNNSSNRNPLLTPPPYKPPPSVTPNQNYRLCVDEFKFALNAVDNAAPANTSPGPEKPLEPITECSSENLPPPSNNEAIDATDDAESNNVRNLQSNVISVREATKKFNRIASQEDASSKNSSPVNYKKSGGTKNVSKVLLPDYPIPI